MSDDVCLEKENVVANDTQSATTWSECNYRTWKNPVISNRFVGNKQEFLSSQLDNDDKIHNYCCHKSFAYVSLDRIFPPQKGQEFFSHAAFIFVIIIFSPHDTQGKTSPS